MPKITKLESNKEYVFVSATGNLHIFRFITKEKKRLVLVKKSDAIASVGMKKPPGPLKGDFCWPRDLIFGPKGVRFKYVGEL